MNKWYFSLALLFVPSLIIPSYAFNSLQDTSLHAENAIIQVDIEFGPDKIKVMKTKTIQESTLNNLTMTIKGDVIDLSDSDLKVYSDGKLFKLMNKELGIVMYGKYQKELDNYSINVLFATENGFVKQTITSAVSLPEDKVIEQPKKEILNPYVPELIIDTTYDYRTYWKDTFDFSIFAYDGNVNSRPDIRPHEGKLDNVEITAILSNEEGQVATLSGKTEHGEWKGQYYFPERISLPGEYTVDIIAKYLGKTVSKSFSMFVIGTTDDSSSSALPDNDGDGIPDSTDPDDDNDTILDIVDSCPFDPEDFDGVMDADGCPDP